MQVISHTAAFVYFSDEMKPCGRFDQARKIKGDAKKERKANEKKGGKEKRLYE